jgi:aminopeptidase N
MRTEEARLIRRLDYRPSDWRVESVELMLDLDPQKTLVRSRLNLRRSPDAPAAAPIELDGESLDLLELRIDGRTLRGGEFELSETGLRIEVDTDRCALETLVRIAPDQNTALSGLYVSNGNFYTQCEAQGFRRITFFPDRPDVMARYRVVLRADRRLFPVLLSNGNLVAQGSCDGQRPESGPAKDGWHWTEWEDPFPKPSYLFALVAGRLAVTESSFMRRSGKPALLQVWVEPGNEDKTGYALRSLERAIRWDEERYGLELDLDRFMIVAVGDFNMGAMENKGLNIFNTRYVFAHPRLATDQDFAGVESVVAHEYFHNWTGNRVTCRDWFQLTLKEGLTVFRDQEFSADMMAEQCESLAQAASARAVKRINDVRVLRTAQFAEDAGPMAHPIRPDSYQEINNFYTLTVYEKGAEVIRMLQTFAGREGFRRGMDLYFARHDGQAVTCDDFITAIADANALDLDQFARWYSQAGTPRVRVQLRYDPRAQVCEIHLSQNTPPTPGQAEKLPLQIPFSFGLLAPDGAQVPVVAADPATDACLRRLEDGSVLIDMRQDDLKLRFAGIARRPVPSLARGFSAPVIVEYDWDDEALLLLAAHDSDPFNRWEAGQQLMLRAVRAALAGAAPINAAVPLIRAIGRVLADTSLDPAFKECLISFPSENFIAEQLDAVDPAALRMARLALRKEVAQALLTDWSGLVSAMQSDGPWSVDLAAAGRRALRNAALGWWIESSSPAAIHAASRQFESADNMTDQAAALACLVRVGGDAASAALASFEREYANEPLVMDKWFTMQATAMRLPGQARVVDRVRELMNHSAFSIRNPNKVRALITAFCTGNLAEFHAADGSGYDFWAEQVIAIDALNPQVAARLARALDRWLRFDAARRQLMRAALERVAGHAGLSGDVAEIVGKALGAFAAGEA